MLPGLIAARVLFTKFGQAHQPARPWTNRRPGSRQLAAPTSRQFSRRLSVRSRRDEIDPEIKSIPSRSSIQSISDQNWIPIFRYDLVFLASAISRLKTAQTIFVVGMTPVVYYLYTQDALSISTVYQCVSIATFAMVMLYFMSSAFRRCIGVISISSDHSLIRIGYLSFWGARRNVILEVDDVVPLDEANAALGAHRKLPPYVRVKRYTDKKFYLYLPLWKISIIDQKLFQDVFGEILSR